MDYIVEDRGDGRGRGVYAVRSFVKGEIIAVVSGEIVGEHRLHTLQLGPHTHLYDPAFTGCLLHACGPNAIIYPEKREVRARRGIAAGEAITVDYAHTEDRLVRQFACKCGSPGCRRWIMGRKEEINAEGRRYLEGLTLREKRE
jgi:SET domain-containing protein